MYAGYSTSLYKAATGSKCGVLLCGTVVADCIMHCSLSDHLLICLDLFVTGRPQKVHIRGRGLPLMSICHSSFKALTQCIDAENL